MNPGTLQYIVLCTVQDTVKFTVYCIVFSTVYWLPRSLAAKTAVVSPMACSFPGEVTRMQGRMAQLSALGGFSNLIVDR